MGIKPTDNSISRPVKREHDDNDSFKIATQSVRVCDGIQGNRLLGYLSLGDYRISTRFNSGRQRSRHFRYPGV